ncbi:hypothetical protein [Alkaliphilus metalliredigens]|nr:hypothetical protein [Alkaliphilus metalliredigens]
MENYLPKFLQKHLPVTTDEAQMILMCIDSSYLPFYSDYFKPIGTKWMNEVLEYPELTELTKKYSKADFEALNKKYNLKGKINIDGGYLSTNINLTELSRVFSMPINLPPQKFEVLRELKTYTKSNLSKKPSGIFSLALTRKNEVKYSKLIKEVK